MHFQSTILKLLPILVYFCFEFGLTNALLLERNQVGGKQGALSRGADRFVSLPLGYSDLAINKQSTKSFLRSTSQAVRSDVEYVNQTLVSLFSRPRHTLYDYEYKSYVKNNVRAIFESYGLQTKLLPFTLKGKGKGSQTSHNILGVLKSLNYGTQRDSIIVIGAHYDTVKDSPGIDDNGSGSTAVLECARILSQFKSTLRTSIYFVLFDEEESGKLGSTDFVRNYLIDELKRTSARFLGAFIMDMILTFDQKPNVQTVSADIQRLSPGSAEWIKYIKYRGDYISVWSRTQIDSYLWEYLYDSWNERPENPFKFLVIEAQIPAHYKDMNKTHLYSDFFRSDHVPFWQSANYGSTTETLPAILLWDLGPWRGYQEKCYHKPCDDTSQLTAENLSFLNHVIESVCRATLKLATSL